MNLNKISHRIKNSQRAARGWREPVDNRLTGREYDPLDDDADARNASLVVLPGNRKRANSLRSLRSWSLGLKNFRLG